MEGFIFSYVTTRFIFTEILANASTFSLYGPFLCFIFLFGTFHRLIHTFFVCLFCPEEHKHHENRNVTLFIYVSVYISALAPEI